MMKCKVGMGMKGFAILLLIVFVCINVLAQKIEVKSFKLMPSDLSASIYEKKDLEGNACALLKVLLPIKNATFEGNIVGKTEFRTNEYWAYLSQGTKNIRIKAPGYPPLFVKFQDYKYMEVESKQTYELVISIPKQNNYTIGAEKLLKTQYDILAAKAKSCYEKKNFKEAKVLYEQMLQQEYSNCWDTESLRMFALCDTILDAQKNHRAITEVLASAFKDVSFLSMPVGFSENMMVIDHLYGHVTLISTEGKVVNLDKAFLDWPKKFYNGMLPINLKGENCFLNKSATITLDGNSTHNSMFENVNNSFGIFIHGLSCVYNRKTGKKALVNQYGQTVLPLGSYKGIWVLKDKIVVATDKEIFRYVGPRTTLRKKDLMKILDYTGHIVCVNDDYILTCDSQNRKCQIFAFDDENFTNIGNLYAIECDRIQEYSSELVVCEIGNKCYLYNFKLGYQNLLEDRPIGKYGGLHLVGKKCYEADGNLKFTLPQRLGVSPAGYIDGFLLVSDGEIYYYIDENGKKLVNSEFKFYNKYSEEFFRSSFSLPFSDGFGLIMREGKWGLIDRFGTTTFDYQ